MTTSLSAIAHQFFLGQDAPKGPLPPELLAPTTRADIAGFPTMDAAGHADAILDVKDGKVTALRALFDRFGLMQQLGV